MRYLSGEEAAVAKKMMDVASQIANTSPCAKSQRGVVIAKGTEIFGVGCNAPPKGWNCDGRCRNICKEYAVHAEKNAMFSAMDKLKGARGYHMKTVNGAGTPSGTPSCVQCSKDMLAAGLKEFVLLDEKGYCLYEMDEFHEVTLRNLHL